MVYQHFTVIPGMTIAENLLLARGQLPLVVDWRTAVHELEAFMASAPFQLPLDALPMDLSAGQKQKLEILKQLLLNPRLLILDEPTSALGVKQSGVVLKYVLAAKERGIAVVFITHNPHHAHLVGDKFYLLNRGKLMATYDRANVSREELVKAMAGGAELEALSHELKAARGESGSTL